LVRRGTGSSGALALVLIACAVGAAPARAADPVPVAPGVRLSAADVAGDAGTNHYAELSVDLGAASVRYADTGAVADAGALGSMPTLRGAVAAVNGDFFDAGASLAPLGAAVRDGDVLSSPAEGRTTAAVFDGGGRGAVAEVAFTGTAGLPDGGLRLDRLNAHDVPPDGAGVFTPAWGASPRGRAVHGAERVAEVEVVDGVVRAVRAEAGDGRVPAGARVLVGREAAADRLARLAPGDRVSVDWDLTAEGFGRPHTAIGGRHVLLRDGEVPDLGDTTRNPRAAIGFSADGRRMFVVTADGRAPGTRGATLREMGERLRLAGADDGLELDGGRSAALLTRDPGDTVLRTRTRTGEAQEPPVANGLAVHVPAGSGRAHGMWVRPAVAGHPGTGDTAPLQPDPARVFTGLRRTLAATPHDEAQGPAPAPRGPVVWRTDNGRVRGGVLLAGRPGPTEVTARAGRVSGTARLEVLAAPERLAADPAALALRAPGAEAVLAVAGVAPGGERAPIEPADVASAVSPEGLAEVAPRADGALTVRAGAAEGTGTLALTAAGRTVEVPLSVGAADRPVAGFDDAADWTASSVRARASVRPTEGRSGDGLALAYDFTEGARSRAAYALPPEPIEVPGHAFGFRMWVRGDGGGSRVALVAVDAEGGQRLLHGPDVDWEGWREARFPVPDGVPGPLAVHRVYLVETVAERTPSGEVVFDDLAAEVALGGPEA
jgi:hypothetical protein